MIRCIYIYIYIVVLFPVGNWQNLWGNSRYYKDWLEGKRGHVSNFRTDKSTSVYVHAATAENTLTRFANSKVQLSPLIVLVL